MFILFYIILSDYIVSHFNIVSRLGRPNMKQKGRLEIQSVNTFNVALDFEVGAYLWHMLKKAGAPAYKSLHHNKFVIFLWGLFLGFATDTAI